MSERGSFWLETVQHITSLLTVVEVMNPLAIETSWACTAGGGPAPPRLCDTRWVSSYKSRSGGCGPVGQTTETIVAKKKKKKLSIGECSPRCAERLKESYVVKRPQMVHERGRVALGLSGALHGPTSRVHKSRAGPRSRNWPTFWCIPYIQL